MSAKKISLTAEEISLLKEEVIFGVDRSKPYAIIPRQIDPEVFEKISAVIGNMHGKWNTKTRRFEFKTGYSPTAMMATIDTEGRLTIEKDGFFPTPPEVVAFILEWVELHPGTPYRILEPEAGTGAICAGVVQAGIPAESIEVIEMNDERQAELTTAGYRLVGKDFMQYPLSEKFDIILMNPPFEGMQDARHILKAAQHLKDKGRVVAVISAGIVENEDEAYGKVRALADRYEKLPKSAFRASGTAVDTYLLTYTRPEGVTDEEIANIEPRAAQAKESARAEEREFESPQDIIRQIAADMGEFYTHLNSLAAELGMPSFLPPSAPTVSAVQPPHYSPGPSVPRTRKTKSNGVPAGAEQLTIFADILQ